MLIGMGTILDTEQARAAPGCRRLFPDSPHLIRCDQPHAAARGTEYSGSVYPTEIVNAYQAADS